MPPAMELQQEAPWHAHGTLPSGELRTENEVELPKEISEEEAPCEFDSSAVFVCTIDDGV
jgi:hypothetical protein